MSGWYVRFMNGLKMDSRFFSFLYYLRQEFFVLVFLPPNECLFEAIFLSIPAPFNLENENISYDSSCEWGHDIAIKPATNRWFTYWDNRAPTVPLGLLCEGFLHNIYMISTFLMKKKNQGSWSKSDNLIKALCFEVCWVKKQLQNLPFVHQHLLGAVYWVRIHYFIFKKHSWRRIA